MHKGSIIISVLIFSTLAWAQDSKIDNRIYDGNKAVEKENYVAAEKSYREALSLAPEKTAALFNLGNTHFQDEKYDEASPVSIENTSLGVFRHVLRYIYGGTVPSKCTMLDSGKELIDAANRLV